MLRAVVFDYGHTLLDFKAAQDELRACYEEVRRILEVLAISEVPEADDLLRDVSRQVIGLVEESYSREELDELDIVTLFADRFASLGISLPRETVQQIVEMEHRALVSSLEMPPENLQVLRALRDRGLKIGLVSNAHFLPALMREDLERLGIAALVDDAVFSAEIGVRKPHPAIYQKVLGELGVPPEDALFVGDRMRDDIGGARRLGMRAVLTRQFRQEDPRGDPAPDHVVERLPDLLPYVESLLR